MDLARCIDIPSIDVVHHVDPPDARTLENMMLNTLPPCEIIDYVFVRVGDGKSLLVMLRGSSGGTNLRAMLSDSKSGFALVVEALQKMAGFKEGNRNSREKNLAIRRARNEEEKTSITEEEVRCGYTTLKGTPCKNMTTRSRMGCHHHAGALTALCAREKYVAERLILHVQDEFLKLLWRPRGPAIVLYMTLQVQEDLAELEEA